MAGDQTGATAVCYEAPTRFARYTCNNLIGIPKGKILKMITANYATAAIADNDTAGGISWMEKVASDGSTEVTAALDGVWGLQIATVSGGITVGYDVVVKATCAIGPYTTLDDEKGYVLGKALESVASTLALAPTCKVRLNI